MYYTNSRMNLNEVCQYLSSQGMAVIAEALKEAFQYHTWTVNGMIRTDVVEEIFENTPEVFKGLQAAVTTHLELVPYHVAHVD